MRSRVRGGLLLIIAGAAAVIALHLVGLSTSPPGLYNDEASIGYNAWAIAHHGVDEHGRPFPLFFEAFGEWKNPVYIYLLAPFTWVLPLTPAVERLPAALCGLVLCVVAGYTALHLTRSRVAAWLLSLTAGLTPWMVLEARVGFEVISLVLCVAIALWCLSRAFEVDSHPGWYVGAGMALSFGIFAYTSGRLFIGLLTLVVLGAGRHGWTRRRGAWLVVPPVVVGYGVLALWGAAHPGALFSRYNIDNITSDHAGLVTMTVRLLRNYASYFESNFLFTHGDNNLRHNTGYGGQLLVVTLPALVVGIAVCVRRWRDPMCLLALLGLALAPLPASLTITHGPTAVRSAEMVPFLLVLMGFGWAALWRTLCDQRAVVSAFACVTLLEVGGYVDDLFAHYPDRALATFSAGETDAITRAYAPDVRRGHRVLISSHLDQPYIQVLFATRPNPKEWSASGLSGMSTEIGDPESLLESAESGDIIVLAAADPVPAGAGLVDDERADVLPPRAVSGQAGPNVVELVRVYRR